MRSFRSQCVSYTQKVTVDVSSTHSVVSACWVAASSAQTPSSAQWSLLTSVKNRGTWDAPFTPQTPGRDGWKVMRLLCARGESFRLLVTFLFGFN